MGRKTGLLFLLLISAARAEAATPCSQRYARQVGYALTQKDIGLDPATLLARWGISGPYWGLKRVHIVRGPKTRQSVLEFFYPQGSINPANTSAPRGGASFYLTGGVWPGVKAACLQYRVYFPEDFAFGKGGKLPGLFGGRNAKGESASGCRPGVQNDGFSTRYMWREGGAGSLYAYLPGKTEKCGRYIGKGRWHFRRGAWTVLEQEVVLNDPGSSNGILRVWVNGRPVIDQPGMVLRNKDGISIDGIFFVSFFGGKEPAWASPKDQRADFSGVKLFLP